MKNTKYAGTKMPFLGKFAVFRSARAESGEHHQPDSLRQLTPEGEEQARICLTKIAALNIDIVFSSPRQRVYDTAQIVTRFERPHTLDALDFPEDMHHPLNKLLMELGYSNLQNPRYNPAVEMGPNNKPGYLEHPLHEALEDWSVRAIEEILSIVEQDSAILHKPLDVAVFGHPVLVNMLMRQLLHDLSGPQTPLLMQQNMTSTYPLGEAQGFVFTRNPELTKLEFVDTKLPDGWKAPVRDLVVSTTD